MNKLKILRTVILVVYALIIPATYILIPTPTIKYTMLAAEGALLVLKLIVIRELKR